MSTTPTTSQGVTLKRGDGATPTETFTLVAGILDFSGPNMSADPIAVTSVDDDFEKVIQGLKSGGEVTLTLNLLGSNGEQRGLLTDFENGTKRNFEIELNDAAPSNKTKIEFTAIVTNYSPSGAVNQQMQLAVTLKVDGQPVFTWAS